MEIVYSSPEAVQRLRDLAESLIQFNGGLTEELRQILDQKADEFGVHRLDMVYILKELAPVQSASAQVRSPGNTRIDIPKESSPVPSTIINEKDGSQLMLIPEGEFLAGGLAKGEGSNDPFPVKLPVYFLRMVGSALLRLYHHPFPVKLPAYYLALYPVTNIQYAQFLSQVQPSERDLEEWIELDSKCFVRKARSRYEAYGSKNDHPVVRVSWFGAKAYTEWAGMRLPSELEWEKGARGLDGLEYPWGNTWDESKCRNLENRGDERTCSVQSYPEGRSPWGLYQMAGNICEWCEDWYDSEAYDRYRQGKLSPPSKGRVRVLRGGSWCSDNPKYLSGAYRSSSEIWNRNVDCGFRLARTVTL